MNFLDEDEHLALLARCVSDSSLPADVRAAGALVLLYGVPITRIAALTRQDLERRSDGMYVILGRSPVLMPPAIERLIMAQAETVSLSVVARVVPDQHQWLFPGLLAGCPMDAARLSLRLLRHGVDVRAARNTALSALASDLPAPVLSQILGMHINTAVDWVKYVKRDWTTYVGARGGDSSDSCHRAGC
ncbi:hypothetical protein [Streptomyces sp. NPDC059918]|uniref:hypothetical protein n=1 Tax=unclassified Streptomyces TaxID=2593676 RepID=UPI00365B62DA